MAKNIKEKRIEIVRNWIDEMCSVSSAEWYMGNSIPYQMYQNACSSYAGQVDYDDVIALIDTTVFGSGKRGMMITHQGIYAKDMLSSPVYAPMGAFNVSDFENNVYFSSLFMNCMFEGLNELQKKASTNVFGGVLSGLKDFSSDLFEAIATHMDNIERLIDWMDNFQNPEYYGGNVYGFLYLVCSLDSVLSRDDSSLQKYDPEGTLGGLFKQEDSEALSATVEYLILILDLLDLFDHNTAEDTEGTPSLGQAIQRFRVCLEGVISEMNAEPEENCFKRLQNQNTMIESDEIRIKQLQNAILAVREILATIFEAYQSTTMGL